jgi:succinate-acetate transporter protein
VDLFPAGAAINGTEDAGRRIPPSAAGWEIFITGLVAWYIATAILVNGVYGRKVLPHS